MPLEGTVLAKSGDWVDVEVAPQIQCGQCRACIQFLNEEDRCRKKTIRALANNFSPREGDRVSLDTLPGERSFMAFLLFGIPLLGFFSGLYFSPALYSWLAGGPESDSSAFFGGLAGFAGGFLLLFALSRAGFLERYHLKVTAVHPDATVKFAPSPVEGNQ